jgi:AcrR family transcriptional regulator
MARTRIRRTPDEAKALILEAAERVFAERLPDVAGLKDVAREAGVSHALITHYFETYENLVEATLERRFGALREALVREVFSVFDPGEGASAILAAYRRAVASAAADPTTVRLLTWAVLSGRASATDFFTNRMKGLKQLADALETRTRVPREDLEFCLVASFAMTVVWRFGGQALSGSLGRRKKEMDAAYEERVTTMIEAYLASVAR